MQIQGTYTWHCQHDLKLKFSDLLKEYIEKEWETGANVGFSKIEWSIAAQQVWFSVD